MEGKRVIYEPCPKHLAQFERGFIVLSCKKCSLTLATPEGNKE